MGELPILFSAPMVRALLAGRKTETRRIVKPQPSGPFLGLLERPLRRESDAPVLRAWFGSEPFSREITLRHKPGDRLWVRETWSAEHRFSGWKPSDIAPGSTGLWYWADGNPEHGDWTRPIVSIHMPRWVSRITLLVDAVRVERVQDITEEAAKAEGIYWSEDFEGWTSGRGEDETCDFHQSDPVESFSKLWCAINGDASWFANPWVTVTQFRVVLRNVDQIEAEADNGVLLTW